VMEDASRGRQAEEKEKEKENAKSRKMQAPYLLAAREYVSPLKTHQAVFGSPLETCTEIKRLKKKAKWKTTTGHTRRD